MVAAQVRITTRSETISDDYRSPLFVDLCWWLFGNRFYAQNVDTVSVVVQRTNESYFLTVVLPGFLLVVKQIHTAARDSQDIPAMVLHDRAREHPHRWLEGSARLRRMPRLPFGIGQWLWDRLCFLQLRPHNELRPEDVRGWYGTWLALQILREQERGGR